MTLSSKLLCDGLVWPESPRWHEDHLWISEAFSEDSGVSVFRPDGTLSRKIPVEGGPAGLDFLADGTVVLAAAFSRKLLALDPGADAFREWVDLNGIAAYPNELIAGPQDRVYVSDSGFSFQQAAYAPGRILMMDESGSVRSVAEDLSFPNGLAISQDGRTLIVAETFASRLTRFRVTDDGSLSDRETLIAFDDRGVVQDVAEMFTREVAPDGICLDALGRIWVANPLATRLVAISQTGKAVAEIKLSQGGVACIIGGADLSTMFICTGQAQLMGEPLGRIETSKIPASEAK